MDGQRNYPDITEIFAKKAKGREQAASQSFAAKLAVLDRLRGSARSMAHAKPVSVTPNTKESQE